MRYLFLLFFSFNVFAVDYELNLIDKDLNQFISWFSDTTKKTIILDKDIDGTVTIFARSGVNSRNLYTLFNDVLSSQGLTYKIENNFIRISLSTIKDNPDDIITTFYDFKNISGRHVTDLIDLLNPMIGQLITNVYLPVKSKKITSKKDNRFSLESFFSGRSLLLTAPRFVHTHFKPIFQRLDQKLPQVLIKVAIVEAVDSDLEELGVHWLKSSGSYSAGVNHGRSLDESLALLIDKVGFDAAISIVNKTSNVKIKSLPQIVVLHAEKGSINVGQNVPFLSGSTVSSGVNTGNPYQTIERQDIGLILQVEPFISNENITLTLSQELSSIANDVQASDIVTDKRKLTTTLNIKDNHSVVLGGLISDFKTSSVSGIPLLMDIPYLGKIFTNTSTKSSVRNLSVALEVVIL
jgi:general secretion pathway protein D